MSEGAEKRDRDSRNLGRHARKDEVESAQLKFEPGELSAIASKPYERAVAKALKEGVASTDTKSLSRLEEDFKLPCHTLVKFMVWKRKQPQELLAAGKTDADRMAANRKKQKMNEEAVQKEWEEKRAQAKEDAAALILVRYKKHLNELVAEAARAAVSLCNSEVTLDAAVKEVAMLTDEYGNFIYHTLQPRTILKHATQIQQNPSYKPLPKGGKPSVINSPDGDEFIAFLRVQFLRKTRTAQNCTKYEDLNKWINEMYKLRYFNNQDASPPEISSVTLRKLRIACKMREHGAARVVAARRWEAMGDPRNYMSFYIAASLGMKDVPLELRFNWDDTSLFVAGEDRGACTGMAFTAEEVARELDLLNRSPGIQLPAQAKGKHCSPRMVQWGFLASGAARLEACVCKVYDRAIAPEDNLRLCWIKKTGDCDIYVLYIRGKQLAAGVIADKAQECAHGGNTDHASERDVAEIVFRDVVAEKIEKRKAEYAVAMRRITEKGFGGVWDVCSFV